MYHGMPFDPKLQVVAKRAGQPMGFVVAVWVCLLDAASRHEPRGTAKIDPEEIAVVQELDVEAVQAILDGLIAKNLMNEQGDLTAWNSRQRNTSTERSQKSRAKKKAATDGNSMQHSATAGNSTQRKNGKNTPDKEEDKERDRDKELDKEITEKEQKGECEREKQILIQMLNIWNAEVQSKISNTEAKLTDKRKKLLKARWKQDFQKNMEAWRDYCQIIAESDFHMGRVAGKDWKIDLTWATASSDNIARMVERSSAGSRQKSDFPKLEGDTHQAEWQALLENFISKYSPATAMSWLTKCRIFTENGRLVLQCSRRFIHQWISQHYAEDLQGWWKQATGHDVTICMGGAS